MEKIENSVVDHLQERGEYVFRKIFDAYPCKNQEKNSSNLMILNLYKSIVTVSPTSNLCICKNCEVVHIDKSDLEIMRTNIIQCKGNESKSIIQKSNHTNCVLLFG